MMMDHALHELHVGVRVVVVVKRRDARDDGRGLARGARLNNGLSSGRFRRLVGSVAAGLVAGSAHSDGSGQREAGDRQSLHDRATLQDTQGWSIHRERQSRLGPLRATINYPLFFLDRAPPPARPFHHIKTPVTAWLASTSDASAQRICVGSP